MASYAVGAAQLVVLVLALTFSAVRLRRTLLPEWSGAPASLVSLIIGLSVLVVSGQSLGFFGLFYGWLLVVVSVAVAGLSSRLRPPVRERSAPAADYPPE